MVRETIELIKNSAVGLIDYYQNNLCISGWILQEPKVFVNAKGVKSVNFIIHQVKTIPNTDSIYDKTYLIHCYPLKVIDRFLKECTTSCFINIVGQVQYQSGFNSYGVFMLDYKISNYLDIPLEPPLQKGEKPYGEPTSTY